MKRFETNKCYKLYANNFTASYRIAKRTNKYMWLYSYKVELAEPKKEFGCGEFDGTIAAIKDLFKEIKVETDYIDISDNSESLSIWNTQVGPILLSSLNEVEK